MTVAVPRHGFRSRSARRVEPGDAAMASTTVLEMKPVPVIAQRNSSAIGGEARAALPMQVHERFGARSSSRRAKKGKSTPCSPRPHELSLCLCLRAGVISGFSVAFAPFRNHGENVVTGKADAGRASTQRPCRFGRRPPNSERKRRGRRRFAGQYGRGCAAMASTVGMPKSGISKRLTLARPLMAWS